MFTFKFILSSKGVLSKRTCPLTVYNGYDVIIQAQVRVKNKILYTKCGLRIDFWNLLLSFKISPRWFENKRLFD